MFDMAAWYCTFEYESIKYGERSVWFDQVKGVGTSTLLTPLVAFFAYQDCAVFVPTPPLAWCTCDCGYATQAERQYIYYNNKDYY